MSNNTFRHFLIAMVSIVTFFGLMTDVTYAQSYDVDESGNVVFYSPDGSQSVSQDNLIKPNHGVVLFGYQNTYTDVIDAAVLPRALGNNRAIANSETRIGRYYSTLSQGEIQNNGFDVGQEHQGVVSSGSESWAYSHLVKINQLRYEHGLAPVSINLNASGYAYNKSEDMVNNGYFAHQNPEGDNIITQYLAYNPEDEGVHAVGENIAQAYPSTATSIEAQVFDDLLHSPGHYQNMVDPAWDSVGIGFYYNPAVSDKVHFVQLFYTTDYNQKNGVLSEDALAQYYWNYEFYQEKHNPEAFSDFVAEAPVEEEIEEEVVEETEVAVEEETESLDDIAFEEAVQLEESLRAEVEEKRQAQSEAAEELAENEAEVARVELENSEVLTPYRQALLTIEEKELELLNTEDQVLRDEIQAEIDAANLVLEELQDAVAAINLVLDSLNEQQEVLENTVAERAEEKRIAEESLMEQSEQVASMEQVGAEGQEVVVEEVETEVEETLETEEEVIEEEVVLDEVVEDEAVTETEIDGDITFESEEEPTTSNYNVNLQNNIVELQQNTTPPAVEDRSENVEEDVEEEPAEETSIVDDADAEEDLIEEVAESNAEDAESEVDEDTDEEQVQQTEERNLSDFIGRSAGNDDDNENEILGTLLPDTGLAQNTWLILGAVVLLAIGGLLLFFTARRRK